MGTKTSSVWLRIGYYIAIVLTSLMLAMMLACGGAGTDSSKPAPIPPQSAPSVAPQLDIAYSTLRKWSPNDAARGLGLEIVLEQDDVTEEDLVDIIKQLSSDHDPVVIRVFTSKTAYEQEQTSDFGPEYKSDYLLMYVKNRSGSGAYSGFDEIRWMQEVGDFADKYGTKTQLREVEERRKQNKPKEHPVREWTDVTGKYKTKAAFAGMSDNEVELRKEDGTIVTLGRDKLSEADQEYIESLW